MLVARTPPSSIGLTRVFRSKVVVSSSATGSVINYTPNTHTSLYSRLIPCLSCGEPILCHTPPPPVRCSYVPSFRSLAYLETTAVLGLRVDLLHLITAGQARDRAQVKYGSCHSSQRRGREYSAEFTTLTKQRERKGERVVGRK